MRNPDNRIREWRERRGLSQSALGKLVGHGNQQISKLETGKLALDTHWIEKLSRGLTVEPWLLLRGSEQLEDGGNPNARICDNADNSSTTSEEAGRSKPATDSDLRRIGGILGEIRDDVRQIATRIQPLEYQYASLSQRFDRFDSRLARLEQLFGPTEG